MVVLFEANLLGVPCMRCFISRPEAIGSWFIGSCMEFLSVRIDIFDQKLLDDFFAEGGAGCHHHHFFVELY